MPSVGGGGSSSTRPHAACVGASSSTSSTGTPSTTGYSCPCSQTPSRRALRSRGQTSSTTLARNGAHVHAVRERRGRVHALEGLRDVHDRAKASRQQVEVALLRIEREEAVRAQLRRADPAEHALQLRRRPVAHLECV